jgi:hypothetical protein
MHITSRALFIGPVPRGWTQRKEDSRRSEYYLSRFKESTGVENISRRALTFTADENVGNTRRVTGLEVEDQTPGDAGAAEDGRLGRKSFGERGRSLDGLRIVESRGTLNQRKSGSSDRLGREENRNSVKSPKQRSVVEDVVLDGENIKVDQGPKDREGRPISRKDSKSSLQGLRIISPEPLDSEALRVEEDEPELEESETNPKTAAPVDSSLLDVPAASNRSPSPGPVIGATVVRQPSINSHNSAERRGLSTQDSNANGASTRSPILGDADSGTYLLKGKSRNTPTQSPIAQRSSPSPPSEEPSALQSSGPIGILSKILTAKPTAEVDDENSPMPKLSHHIRFDLTNQATRSALIMRAHLAQQELGSRIRNVFHAGEVKQGEILKMEKMLVREDVTQQKKLPDDFDENTSQGVVSTTVKKWREYMIVCRRSEKIEGARYVLQAYKTRVSEQMSFDSADMARRSPH